MDPAHFLEGRGLSAGDIVDIEAAIVDKLSLRASVSSLGDADVATVLVLEEHDGCPVVRLVLDEAARRALGELGRVVVGVHGDVKRISSNNLMKMGREFHARVDKGIRSFNDQLGACEPQHILTSGLLREERRKRSSKSSPLHVD